MSQPQPQTPADTASSSEEITSPYDRPRISGELDGQFGALYGSPPNEKLEVRINGVGTAWIKGHQLAIVKAYDLARKFGLRIGCRFRNEDGTYFIRDFRVLPRAQQTPMVKPKIEDKGAFGLM